MEKQIKIAVTLVKAYEQARQKGILALRQFDFESEQLQQMMELTFELLLNKELHPQQIYEILQNYGEDFEDKTMHKLIVNGIMCIIAGDPVNYVVELLASILGLKNREEFIREIKDLVGDSYDKEQTIQKMELGS